MKRVVLDMARTNPGIRMDEVAVVNVLRGLVRSLPAGGYGEATIKVEFAGHFVKFIWTTLSKKTKVDRRAPSFTVEVIDVTQSEEEEVQAGGPQGHSGS